jgi:AcrR family transcriptional regulator
MGARPKLTQKRRTQMLEAAMEVIADRGLCDTRIADVAERAGSSPALVVYYFGTKEKLLTEALAYAEDLFYIEAFRELTGIEGASERLVRLIELACPPVVRREADEYWTLWVELWSRALRNDEAARKREALERRWRRVRAVRPRALRDVPLRANGRPRAPGIVRRPCGERKIDLRDVSGRGGPGVGLRAGRLKAG